MQEASAKGLREQEGVCEEAVREARRQWEGQLEEVVTGRLGEGRTSQILTAC